MNQCLHITGKAQSTTSGYIQTAEEVKKYSIIKMSPENSAAIFTSSYTVFHRIKKNCAAGSWGCRL